MLDTRRRLLHHAFAQAEQEILAVIQSKSYQEILSALIGEALALTGPDAQLEVAETELALCRAVIKQ